MANAATATESMHESLENNDLIEGSVVKGKVIAIENGQAIVDVGFKMEGRIDIKEFAAPGKPADLEVGDEVEVYLDRTENAKGESVLSRDKARREEAWDRLEKAFEKNERVEGAIFGRVKGGFTVDLGGAVAFLPGSQVDVRPVRDVGPLMNTPQPFQILKMDRRRGNIVVSRRAILEETRAEQRSEIVGKLNEGDVVEGVVKNITDYGAFVDLGGVDGLLHVTDMAWRRVNHPTEILSIGQTLQVQVVKVNKDTQRISLGMKQLQSDPWDGVDEKFPLEGRHKGRVTNITDYGAFVELEPGVEGLVHVSEMSWTKKNVHPGKIVSTSQEVEVMVLDVDASKRRISLGLKQCMDNHLSDLDWNRSGEEAIEDYKKGDMIKAVVLDVDVEKERISLGVKQVGSESFDDATDGLKRGSKVEAEIVAVTDNGLEVKVEGQDAFIRRGDLARDRDDQKPDNFKVGDKVEARVTTLDPKTRKIGLSIKALEVAEEKEAVEQFGSSDAGASLGDILGAALKQRDED